MSGRSRPTRLVDAARGDGHALPADRELRRHRQPADGGAGRAWTAPSTGSACRTSTRRASSPPSWTTRRAAASASPRRATASGTSSSTGRTPTSWSPASCTPTASARSRTTCRSAAPAAAPRPARPPGAGRPRPAAVPPGVPARLRLRPRPLTRRTLSEHGARFDGPGLSLGLAAPVPLRPRRRRAWSPTSRSAKGEKRHVRPAAASTPRTQPGRCPGRGEAEELFRETVAYWRRWLVEVHLHAAAGARWSTARPWRSSS